MLKTCIGTGTVWLYLIYIYTFVYTKVNFLLLCFLSINPLVCINTHNAEQSALYLTVLLDVVNHLIHDGCRNSETIAGVRTCLGIKHGIDTNQFTTGVYECTARVALVYGSIGLYERLYAVSPKRTCLGTYDTCRYGAGEVEWIAYCKHPFAYSQLVRITYRKCWQIFCGNLYESKVGSLVGADDCCGKLPVVVKGYRQFVSAIYHVVVCYDISVGRDYDTRAGSLLLRSLHLLLTSSVARIAKESEWVEEVSERI